MCWLVCWYPSSSAKCRAASHQTNGAMRWCWQFLLSNFATCDLAYAFAPNLKIEKTHTGKLTQTRHFAPSSDLAANLIRIYKVLLRPKEEPAANIVDTHSSSIYKRLQKAQWYFVIINIGVIITISIRRRDIAVIYNDGPYVSRW